jgi:hypothetical protein
MTKLLYPKTISLIFFLLLGTRAFAPDMRVGFVLFPEPIDPYNKLINAVIQVESMGDTMAYNSKEEATGAFQIRPIRLRDYNQRTGNNYKSDDCYNLRISREIFMYYARRFEFSEYELIARNWNGSGKSTQEYWEKVKSNL